jgi:hypothetical protein
MIGAGLFMTLRALSPIRRQDIICFGAPVGSSKPDGDTNVLAHHHKRCVSTVFVTQ